MKKAFLLLLLISMIGAGCKKKEEAAPSVDFGGGVQTIQDTGQAEAQYKDILAKDPGNYNAIVGLANLYYDAGEPAKAIEMYQKALNINPNDANLITDMGTMYRIAGDFDKAIEAFRKAASTDPKHEQSRYNLGVTLYDKKSDPNGAADAWEELLKINPNHPNAEGLRQMIDQIKGKGSPKPASPSSGWVK